MIGGVIKELFTITLGVNIFGDVLTTTNVCGFAIVLVGVFGFKVSYKKKPGSLRGEKEDIDGLIEELELLQK